MSFEQVGVQLVAQDAAQYTAALTAGDKALDAFSASAAASAANVAVFDDSLRKIKIAELTNKLSEQQKTLAVLTQELQETATKYGEGSVQAQKKALAVDKLSNAIGITEQKITRENAALDQERAAFDAAGHAAGASAAPVEQLGKATRDAGKEAEQSAPKFDAFKEIVVGALRKIGEIAVSAFMQAGQAAVSFLKDSIGVAGDFESGMNRASIAIGDALDGSNLTLQDFRKDFIQLGKELPVSTSDVQDAFVDLVKGGVDPMTLHLGGLKSSIQFAAAAEIDLTKAAELSARQLGVWVDAGASAEEQAKFLAMSQDVMVKAANAGLVGVDDLARGMNIAGGPARALNVDYRDFAVTMAEIAPAFNSTEEAGTSYKNFLTRLQPTTKPAIAAMQALGLYTEENGSAFFDATGKYVGNREAARLLHDATKDLTDQQRALMLQTIFGNDAMGAANKLAHDGIAGYDAMSASVDNASGVMASATTMQGGFNTAMTNFKGSVEALQITIGSYLLPVLTDLFNNYLAPGINIMTDLAGALGGDQEALNNLSPPLQAVVTWLESLWANSGGVSDLWTNTFQPAITAVGDYFDTTLAPILNDLATAVMPALGASVDIVAGFWSDVLWPALHTFWDLLNATVIPIIADLAGWLADNLPGAISAVSGFLTDTLFPAFHEVYDFLDGNVIPILGDVTTWLADKVGSAVQVLADFWTDTLWPALKQVWSFLNTYIIPIFETIAKTVITVLSAALQSLANFWTTILWPAIQKVWSFLDTYIIPIFAAIANVAIAVLQRKIQELANYWTNTLYPAIEKVANWFDRNMKPAMDTIGKAAGEMASALRDTLAPAFTWIHDHILGPAVDWFNSIGQAVKDAVQFLNDLADKIRNMPSLPSALVGHSPPPMAQWMSSIAEETSNAALAFSAMRGQMVSLPSSPAALMAGGGNSATYNQQRTVNLNYSTQYAPPASQSLAIARALAG